MPTTIDVKIDYAHTLSEEVKAELVDADVWMLTEHAGFSSLAPGDRIKVDLTSTLTEIVSLEPVYVYVVHLHLPAGLTAGVKPTSEHPAIQAVDELFEEWQRETWVTRLTGFTFALSCQTLEWVTDRVVGHPYVESIELIRSPDAALDLADLLARPHFGTTEL